LGVFQRGPGGREARTHSVRCTVSKIKNDITCVSSHPKKKGGGKRETKRKVVKITGGEGTGQMNRRRGNGTDKGKQPDIQNETGKKDHDNHNRNFQMGERKRDGGIEKKEKRVGGRGGEWFGDLGETNLPSGRLGIGLIAGVKK